MKSKATFLVALSCLLLLAGCAGRQPGTQSLDSEQAREAGLMWTRFTAIPRPTALDADARVGWDVLGSKGTVAATLQVQAPGLLRFAATDPLGRALVLAAADSQNFLMVDNRTGTVHRGTTTSRFWQRYIPSAIGMEDLLPLIGGFLVDKVDNPTISGDTTARGFWYQWQDGRGLSHTVLLDHGGLMREHRLSKQQGEPLLVLRYLAYSQTPSQVFPWPATLEMSGKAVTGTLHLKIEQIYSFAPREAAFFQLSPPAAYTVEEVP